MAAEVVCAACGSANEVEPSRHGFARSSSPHEGDVERAEDSFKIAAASCREYDLAFFLATTRIEYAEWLVRQGRAEEAGPPVEEARDTFERVHARPWLERAEPLAGALPTAVAAS